MAESDSAIERQPKTRVLLVDDEDDFRRPLVKQLQLRGYRVFDVDRGEDAIKMVRHKHPHVIVLDLKMNGMDGIDGMGTSIGEFVPI